MGFRDRLLGRKDSAAAAATASAIYYTGDPVWMRVRPEVLAEEGYKRNAWVYGCVNGISRAVKGVPWIAVKPQGERGQRAVREVRARSGSAARERIMQGIQRRELVEVDVHPMLDLFARPNPEMGGGQYFEAMTAFWLISGQAYCEAAGPKLGPPKELWPLRPDRVRILPNAKGRIETFRYEVNGKKVDFTPQQVMMHKFFNPLDDWYGMSPIEAAARAVDRDNAAEAWNTAMLQNGGRPSGALTTEGELDGQQKIDLKKSLKERHEGKTNAGRVLLLEGGLKWEEMGLSPRDMDWIEGQKWSMKRIAAAFGYPVLLLDAELGGSFATDYGEARLALYQDTVLPLMDHMRDDYNLWLAPQYDDSVLLAYDPDGIEALQEDRDKLWARTANDTRLTLNERRTAVGMDEVPEGDVYLMPATTMVTPAGELGVPKEPVAPADPNADPNAEPPADEQQAKKMVNLRDEQRAAYHLAFDQVRAAWERQMESRVGARFSAEARWLEQQLAGAGDQRAANAVVDGLPTAPWQALYRALLSAIILDFGERTRQGLGEKALRSEADPDWFSQGAQQWIMQTAGVRVTQVTDATKALIRQAISEGFQAGESMPKIAARVRELVDGMGKTRSLLIARTEVIGASNAGAMYGARSTGLKLQKEWLATLDGRTRPDHLNADGQVVAMDAPFVVGTYHAQYPGDSSLPPAESCNCRCTVIFQTAGE